MTAWVVFRLGVSCKLTYRDKHHFTQKSGGWLCCMELAKRRTSTLTVLNATSKLIYF